MIKPTLTEYVQALREAAEITVFEYEQNFNEEVKEIVFFALTKSRKFYTALTWFDIRKIVREALNEYYEELLV